MSDGGDLQIFSDLLKRPVFQYLAALSIIALVLFYILYFLLAFLNQDLDLKPFLGILITASPTIPVLFLFSFLLPNLVSLKNRQDFLSPIKIALFITISVLISASFFLSLGNFFMGEGEAFVTMTFYVIPSLLAGVIFFVFTNLKIILKTLISIAVGVLVTSYTGILVVMVYLFRGSFDVFESNQLPTFGPLDVLLLSILGLVLLFYYKKEARLISILLNIMFVITTLLYVYFFQDSPPFNF